MYSMYSMKKSLAVLNGDTVQTAYTKITSSTKGTDED